MILINNVGFESKQELTIDFNGKDVVINLEYFSNQQQWVFSVAYNGFSRQNLLLSLSSNLLKAYQNILPFGFACLPSNIQDTTDPFLCDIDNEVNDFTSDRVRLYIFDITEQEELNNQLFSVYGIQ